MRISTRYALIVSATAALLASCSGSQLPTSVYSANAITRAASRDQTFHYTGSKEWFKVPDGVTQVSITAYGARGALGGNFASGFASSGGNGAMVTATIPVTPRERLAIFVGGSGDHLGFNGGGEGNGYGSEWSFGGGASDVRQGGDRLIDRVVVAAGGGGGGADGYFCFSSQCGYSGQARGGYGGAGGGPSGGSGGTAGASTGGSSEFSGGGGNGATQKNGGEGGAGGGDTSCNGSGGALGLGGAAGAERSCGGNGGGGGGGYYGGGGGGAGGEYGGGTSSNGYGGGGGGGGGASFVESAAKHVKMTAGANKKGDGKIVLAW